MDKVIIKHKHEKRIRAGHLWIFSNELTEIPQLEPGSLIEAFDKNGKSYGYGFYNPTSLIAVRLLQTRDEINIDFFIRRISAALKLRKRIMNDASMFRLVFGESDFLPGLIVDKYEDWLAVQILSAGMEIKIKEITKAMLEVLPATKGIIMKNKSRLRKLEGLPQTEEIIWGDVPEDIFCEENGIKVIVNLKESQKTGYYLDQRDNRKFIENISKGLKVLDCYCNQGGFALHAAMGGASEITGIDSSEAAIAQALRNAAANAFHIDFIKADVEKFLSDSIQTERKWDLLILDPPAFAKNKKNIHSALIGYAKINNLALKLINKEGFLATSSCSHYIDEDRFYEIIVKEAAKQGKQLRLLYRGGQSPDHPILASMPETKYLKFFVFQII